MRKACTNRRATSPSSISKETSKAFWKVLAPCRSVGFELGANSAVLPSRAVGAFRRTGRIWRNSSGTAGSVQNSPACLTRRNRCRSHILSRTSKRLVQAIPRFPAIRRDFSFVLDKGTQYAAVQRMIADVGIPELTRIEPFDRMESGQFAETKYSLSISVVYQSPDRTLTDTEVEGFDRRILDVLEQRLGAQLRK